MLTADTITDEMITELRDGFMSKSNWDWAGICQKALTSTLTNRMYYREQCAELLNERAARAKAGG